VKLLKESEKVQKPTAMAAEKQRKLRRFQRRELVIPKDQAREKA
jgi:hypothetical protein